MTLKRTLFITGALSVATLLALLMSRDAFGSPSISEEFAATAFSGFDGWDCYLEVWSRVGQESAKDLLNRNVFLVNDASGVLVDSYLCKLPRLSNSPQGISYYFVTRKGGMSVAPVADFTGTLVFRESRSILVGLGLEPRRTSLRYFRGKLVESFTTRTDL